MEKLINGPETIIGALTQISGNLQGDEDLRVYGRVDGNVSLTKTLTVEPSGVLVADIQVSRAVISGTVVGNITASDLVHITEEGRVVGDLRAPRIMLVDGASFRGNIDMGDVEQDIADVPRRAAEKRPEPVTDETPTPAPARKATPIKKTTPRGPRPAPRPITRASSASRSSTLVTRASAAAQAVAQAVRKKEAPKPKKAAPAKSTAAAASAKKARAKKAPKPPTTAGKKTRAKRK
ncbi:MAG: polymer-forming cytoskeletal protein [Deltaproteobacteria bacterium]|nr:polymer-forming cytoskeletal protein [Deltaproteobacteria bacterium]